MKKVITMKDIRSTPPPNRRDKKSSIFVIFIAAMMIAAVMPFILADTDEGMNDNVLGADDTYSITGKSVADIQTGIQGILDGMGFGDTLTVTGEKDDANVPLTLTIKDKATVVWKAVYKGEIESDGALISVESSGGYGAFEIADGSEIEAEFYTGYYGCALYFEYIIVTVSGGTVTAENCNAIDTAWCSVTVSGGTVTARNGSAISLIGGDLLISDGDIFCTGNDAAVCVSTGSITMTGGTVTADLNGGSDGCSAVLCDNWSTAKITGGTVEAFDSTNDYKGDCFTINVYSYSSAMYLTGTVAEGKMTNNENNTCTIAEIFSLTVDTAWQETDRGADCIFGSFEWNTTNPATPAIYPASGLMIEWGNYDNTPCFSVGADEYVTLEEAAAEVADGGKIVMLKDVTLNWSTSLDEDKTYTVDMDGHTFSNIASCGDLIYISSGTVTFLNGNIDVKEDTNGIFIDENTIVILDDLTVTSGMCAINNYGTLTVLSGTYDGGDFAICCGDGTVTITAGHFLSDPGNNCLGVYGDGEIVLAEGSVPSVELWLNGAEDVTIWSTYPAIVTNGTGGGDYKAGAIVTITADAPPVGKEFDKWTSSDDVAFDDANSAETTFVMPAGPVTVSATYKLTLYTVTVNNGTSDKLTAALGATVQITADAPPDGQKFENWTSSDVTFGDANSPSTTFTMIAGNVTVKANYVSLQAGEYSITVQNDGHGTANADVTSSEAGEVITLTAVPSEGYEFDEWQIVSGSVTFADKNNANTTFVMPAGPVTVSATCKLVFYTVTVNNGTSDTPTAALGATVQITADAPPDGQKFENWTSSDVTFGDANSTSTTFTMIAGNVTVKANYVSLPDGEYLITVQNDGNGTASADVTSSEAGEVITLTAVPSDGYKFKEWQIVSGSVTFADKNNANTTFTMTDGNVTVKAVFETTASSGGDGGGGSNTLIIAVAAIAAIVVIGVVVYFFVLKRP